jgi:hypothetical protein
MNLMDTLMDEFQDETKIAQMEEREIMSWLEVNFLSGSESVKVFFIGALYQYCLASDI